MSTIKRFEEILAWKEARSLTAKIYSLAKESPLVKDFGLKDQLQRAAVSIGSNIAEGFERNGNKEFVKFLWIAKGSAGEVTSQLYTAKDIGYIDEQTFTELYDLARRCSYLIYQLITAIKSAPIPGERYK